jgi:hypothetical protein
MKLLRRIRPIAARCQTAMDIVSFIMSEIMTPIMKTHRTSTSKLRARRGYTAISIPALAYVGSTANSKKAAKI